MKEQNIIEINGKKIEIPDYVRNIEAFREYKTKDIEYQENPKRNYTFKNGKELRLPCPNIKKYFAANPDCISEKNQVEKLSKEFRKTQGQLTALKKKCTSEDGNSYGPSIKKDLLEEWGPQILEWFGEFKSPFEVHRILIGKGIKELSYNTITKFFHQNSTKVRELRVQIKEDYDDLSVGIKRSRLEKLDYLLQTLYADFDKAIGSARIQLSREIRGIIEQARKEVEGDELKLTVNGRIDIQATIEASIKKTNAIQQLTIAQMVIARVCNRSNGVLSYNQMVNRLAHSFYSRFNGFRPAETLVETPIYPSSVTYDILELEGPYIKQKQIEKERDLLEEERNIQVEVPELRDSLFKFIDKIKKDNEQSK